MDIPRGLRSASKQQLLQLACNLAGNEATLAQALRDMGAHDIAGNIKLPASGLAAKQAGNTWIIDGDTFQIKDILKRRGARWNGMQNAWSFQSLQEAQAAIAECEPILAVRQELAALEAA